MEISLKKEYGTITVKEFFKKKKTNLHKILVSNGDTIHMEFSLDTKYDLKNPLCLDRIEWRIIAKRR